MKKLVTLLSVALFAAVFAAGCGGHKECSQATSKEECKEEKFEKDTFICVWDDAANPKVCKNDAFKAVPAAKAECAKVSATDCVTGNAAAIKATKDANEVPLQKAFNKANTKEVECTVVSGACTATIKP